MVNIENFFNGKGIKYAMSYNDLQIATWLSFRGIRKAVADAKKRGIVIINLQDGAGYFIPSVKDVELVKRAYKQEQKRAINILVANKVLRNWLCDVNVGRLKDGQRVSVWEKADI